MPETDPRTPQQRFEDVLKLVVAAPKQEVMRQIEADRKAKLPRSRKQN